MKAKQNRFALKRRALLAGFALSAIAGLSAAPRAEANSAAGGTILNTVTVTYKDSGLTQSYSANATASVTINLVKAALTDSGMPTATNKGKTAPLPVNQTTDSGGTDTYIIALTANANGGDNYILSETTGTLTNMNSAAVTWSALKSDGITTFGPANPTSVALGASVIQANTATTISIPGGSNLVANLTLNSAGFKTIVVNGVDYIVTNIAAGNKASNTNIGNTLYTGLGTATAEVLDVLTLAANPAGSNTTPAFTVNALLGQVAAEQMLIKVSVTGIVGATVGTDGTVPFTITTTDSATGNSVTSAAITTTFHGSNLQIRKTVRNCGQSTAVGVCGAIGYGATASGIPGDILEYKVDVINAGSSTAKVVSAQDAVPVYTTLVSFTGAYGDGGTLGTGVAANNFASVFDGTTTVPLTMGVDADSSSVASGDVAGITANTPIHFYLGTGNVGTAATGGSIVGGVSKTYTILYRMKMN